MNRFKLLMSALLLAGGFLSGCEISDPDRSASAPPQGCGYPPDCDDL